MNTNMTEFRYFSKNLCVLVLWTKVASALEGAGVDKDQLSVGNTLILTGVGVIFQFDHND